MLWSFVMRKDCKTTASHKIATTHTIAATLKCIAHTHIHTHIHTHFIYLQKQISFNLNRFSTYNKNPDVNNNHPQNVNQTQIAKRHFASTLDIKTKLHNTTSARVIVHRCHFDVRR